MTDDEPGTAAATPHIAVDPAPAGPSVQAPGAADPAPTAGRHPWQVAGFRALLGAQSVSWFGSGLTLVALPLLLFQRTGSSSLTALIVTVEAVPYLVFGLLAGALADRWDRRVVMVATAVVDALVVGSVPTAAAAGLLTTPHLLLVALLTSTTWVFHDAASFGVVPALVGRQRMADATGLLATSNTVLTTAGPALGGILVAVWGATQVMAVDALSYFLAAALLARLPALGRLRPSDRAGAGTPISADIREGLRHVWTHPVIRALTLIGIGNSLTSGALLGLLVVFGVRGLGLPADDGRLGLLYAAVAVGGLLASLLLPVVTRVLPVGRVTIGGLVLLVAATLCLAGSPGLATALAALAAAQAAATLVSLNGITYRQTVTPEHLQSRVNTTARMIAWSGQPAGAALAGVLADGIGARPTVALASLGAAVSLLAALLTPLRRTDLAPPGTGS